MPEPIQNDEYIKVCFFFKKDIFFEISKYDFKSIPGVPGAIFNPPPGANFEAIWGVNFPFS